MRISRIAALFMLGSLMLTAGSCGWVAGGDIDVPDSLRSRAASDFPEFEVIDVDGSTVTGSDAPGRTEQWVIFSLKHRQFPFYTTVQYEQVFDEGDTPPGWTLNESDTTLGAPSFKGRLNERSRSFVEFFADRYPDGEMLYQGAALPPEDMTFSESELEASLWPRTDSQGFGCSTTRARSEAYEYDAVAREWSVK